MRRVEAQVRADRHNPCRIDFALRDVVVTLDVIKVHRLRDAGRLIKILQIALQVRIIENPANVAFEVAVIHRIEANERANSRQSVSTGLLARRKRRFANRWSSLSSMANTSRAARS